MRHVVHVIPAALTWMAANQALPGRHLTAVQLVHLGQWLPPGFNIFLPLWDWMFGTAGRWL